MDREWIDLNILDYSINSY